MKLRCWLYFFCICTAGGCALNPLPIEPLPDLSQFLGPCVMEDEYYQFKDSGYYPRKAIERKQNGYVFLLFDIKDGKAMNIEVLASSPKGFFEDAAINTLQISAFKKEVEETGCATYRTFVMGDEPGYLDDSTWFDLYLL